MKIVSLILLVVFIISACESVEPDTSEKYPLPAIKIEKIEVENYNVVSTILVGTPTPCWHYFQTEKSQDDFVYTAKIFGKYDGQPCLQMTGSFIREEVTITFLSSGVKTLRFWQNDSTYLDTTITLQ